jgi:hypothetical protein
MAPLLGRFLILDDGSRNRQARARGGEVQHGTPGAGFTDWVSATGVPASSSIAIFVASQRFPQKREDTCGPRSGLACGRHSRTQIPSYFDALSPELKAGDSTHVASLCCGRFNFPRFGHFPSSYLVPRSSSRPRRRASSRSSSAAADAASCRISAPK